MTSGTTKLLERITAGEVTAANAGSQIDRAGGESLVLIELFRAMAAGGGGGPPSGGAGGVLSGSYPNPGFAVDMATQAELDAAAALKANLAGGNTFTAAQTVNTGTLTASAAPLAVTQTRNNGAVLFEGITLDITDTASATDSRWLRLLRNSTDWFALQKSAFADPVLQMRRTGDANSSAVYVRGGNAQMNFGFGAHTSQERISFASDYSALAVSSTWSIGFCSAAALGGGSSNPDAFFTRFAAAGIQMGATSASPIAQTFKGPNGSGTNIAGGKLCLAPGQSTGNATPAVLALQGAIQGSSGSTAQTLVDVLTIPSYDTVKLSAGVLLQFGEIATGDGALVADHYLTVKDSAGTSYRLLVMAIP